MKPLGPWYPSTWRGRPPSMHYEDWHVWQQYIRHPDASPYEYAYDVALIFDRAPDTERDQVMREMWERNNARRIDAVGRHDSHYALFEARRHASWSTIGQLTGYATLWPMFYPDLELDELVIVCETIPDEIRAYARSNRIRVWVTTEKTS